MSREKPKLSLGNSDDLKTEENPYDSEQIERASERSRVPFSTTLDAGLYEKLKAAHFYDKVRIADIVNEAVRQKVRELENQRESPYDVPEPLRIDDES
jgi:hypothetical protein